MKSYPTWGVRAALFLGCCVVFTGCTRGQAKNTDTAPPSIMFSYPVVEPKVSDYADYSGRIAAIKRVEVQARVWGYLQKVNFKEGALVKAGDVLYEIDSRTYKAQCSAKKAQVDQNEASVRLAKVTYERNFDIFKKEPGAVSLQILDKYKAEWDQAIANLNLAEANLKTAQLYLSWTNVTAPISGRVSRTLVTEGNIVQSADQPSVTLLTTIVSVDPIYAYFDVGERTVEQFRKMIRQGQAQSPRDDVWPVFMGLPDEEGFPYEGRIDFVDNEVNPKTGTLKMRGVFANRREFLTPPFLGASTAGLASSPLADGPLLAASALIAGRAEFLTPGFYVRVRVPVGVPHRALLISDRAIDTDQGQKIVYVIDEHNKIQVRNIRPGALHDGLRLIEEGLNKDDRVVVNGLQHIRPDMPVEPKLVDMPRSGKVASSQ